MRETILILGESNAGGYNSLSPPQVYPNASRISIIRNVSGALQIQPASDPLIQGSNFGVGPGMGCADEYLSLRNDPSLEVVLMVGVGLHISDWAPALQAYTISVSAGLFGEQCCGPVVGIVWTQGINDALAGNWSAWPIDTRALFANLRLHFNNPTLPIVMNGLPMKPASANQNWDLIQRWINQMPGHVDRLATVNASDLAVNGIDDPYHFTAPSAVTLGRRDANALVGLLQ